MEVETRQRLGKDLYILFEANKFKYDISLFDGLVGKYVYATSSEKDSLDFFVSEDDYSYLEEGGNHYIEFNVGFPTTGFYAFKVLDVKPNFDRVASIINIGDINPTNLNLEFDNIKDYMYLLQETLSKKTLRYDADFDSSMLPKLSNGEFWIKTDTGFRASNFETLEALITDAFKDFFGIIGGENSDFIFKGVTSSNGTWKSTDLLGQVVDGIAIQKGDTFGTYYVMTSGFVAIPTSETDDTGTPFVTDKYYYQSLTVSGKFSPSSPVSGINKKVFKVLETNNVQYALILNYPHTIGNGTVDSKYVKYFNSVLDMQGELTLGLNQLVKIGNHTYKIGTETTGILLTNGFYALPLSVYNFNTVAEMVAATYLVNGDRIKLWGYYNLFDNASHKRIKSATDDGSGIALDSGGFAILVHDGEVSNKWFGAKGGGIEDDTLALQKCLNFDANIDVYKDTYKTTNSLFNQISNRTINFNGSKIINKNNNRYAIVTVSDALLTQNDASLDLFVAEYHFGEEIKNSHVLNLQYEMSSNSGSGANLGIGIVYGKYCNMNNVECLSTNGNGIQVSLSLGCELNARIKGHRVYGIFHYKSKNCKIKAYVEGGMRGCIVKHAYYDDAYVNLQLDLTTHNVTERALGGGASAKTGTPVLDPVGHEIVRNVNVSNINISNDSNMTTSSPIRIGLHADEWIISNLVVNDKSTETSKQILNIGGEGTLGYAVGGGHLIENIRTNFLECQGTSLIVSTVPATLKNVYIEGQTISCLSLLEVADVTKENIFVLTNFHFNGKQYNQSQSLNGLVTSHESWDKIEIEDSFFNLENKSNPLTPAYTSIKPFELKGKIINLTDSYLKINIVDGENTDRLTNIFSASKFSQLKSMKINIKNVVPNLNLRALEVINTNHITKGNFLELEDTSISNTNTIGIRYNNSEENFTNENIIIGNFLTKTSPF